MATKIEGYVDGTDEGPEFRPYKEGNKYFPFWEAQGITLKPKFDYWKKAVVVVTEERIFTESEVRAMLLKIRNDCHAAEDIVFLDTLAKDELGIVLDPATLPETK